MDTTQPLFGHDFFEYSLVGPAINGLPHQRWQDNDTETDDANGAMVSAQAIIINGTVVNAGTVDAQTQLAINAPLVHNTGIISANDAMTINGELTNTGLMTANSMAIASDALVQNLGHMHAQEQLQINAGQFVNAGQAKSRQVHVVSSSDLVNQGAAHLSAGDSMQLTSTSGSIVNDVAVSNHQVDGFMAQTLDSTGMIHSGGKLHATAAKNVTQLGKIIVDGDANIMAGNTIELGGTMIQHKGSDNRGDTEVSNYYVDHPPALAAMR